MTDGPVSDQTTHGEGMTITDSPTITMSDICAAISSGDHDDNLRQFERTIKNRKAVVAHALAPKWGESGTKTGVLANLRPKYLVGAPITVIKRNRTRLSIKVDQDWLDAHPQAKARWSGVITATPEMIVLD